MCKINAEYVKSNNSLVNKELNHNNFIRFKKLKSNLIEINYVKTYLDKKFQEMVEIKCIENVMIKLQLIFSYHAILVQYKYTHIHV